jgi:putative membrane protein
MLENGSRHSDGETPAADLAGNSPAPRGSLSPRRAASWITAAGLTAGVALFYYVLRRYNLGEVLAAVATAGWGVVWVSAYRFVTIATDAAGWRELWLPATKPGPSRMLVFRWIGESVNGLLPVAQVGGHVARARLLGRSQGDYVAAGAATIVDFTAGVFTQAIYTVLGIGLLLRLAGARGEGLNNALLLALALLVAGMVTLYVMQRGRMLQKAALLVRRALAGNLRSMSEQLHSGAQAIDSAVNEIYGRYGVLARCVAWRMLTWLLHTGETWLIMYFLGAPVSWSEALILESLSTAVRNAAFPVPAGLGAQEGGLVLLGGALGIAPSLCLALSLAKRARELIVGLPALAAWAWLEGRSARG